MARPFKPPPMQDQVLDTINPLNWFSGLIWKNIQGDIDYHLTARDHRKIQGLPPISPIDIKESAGFGPAGLSVDPREYFKYGLSKGIWSQTKRLLKISLDVGAELDSYSDWEYGFKPKLIQEDGNTNSEANKFGLVKKKQSTTGDTFLEGWVESTNATENEKQSRLKLYTQLEWWTKTENIKPYRDLAWKPIMESAIESAYFTAERQRNEGIITQTEFDHFKSEFDRVVNKDLDTSIRSVAGETTSFKNTSASGKNIKEMLTNEHGTRDNYYASIQADQDYNVELHQLFSKIVAHDHGHRLINLERDTDGKRLIENLEMLDHGESHFAWKDFLQKFDKGGTLRDYMWDSVSSVDLIRIAEPIYAVITRGGTMSPKVYKTLGRLTQIGAKTFPFNIGSLIASGLSKSGYFGLSKGMENNFIKFNNFAYLEFKEGRFGWSGFGAKFKASQLEGVLWNLGAGKKDKESLYSLINEPYFEINKVKYSKYASKATYFKGLNKTQVAEIGRLLLTPDQLVAEITKWLDPTLSAKGKAEFLAKLTESINKYKGSEGFLTLQNLVNQGKLKDFELFHFLGLADTKGLNAQYQGFVGFASKLPDQLHNLLQTISGEMWKLPGLKHLFPLWSKYKLSNLFFNNPFAMKLGNWLGKLLGGAVAGPLGAIIGYVIEDFLHKFISNIWAGLTGGHPHAYVGDNTKKMFIIGCGAVLAIIALPIFIIIIILGGAFAWLGGGNNESGEIIVNQDVMVNVRNLDTPITTIANNLATSQDTKFDITIKNNLDKEINVWGVTISEYTEDNYWKDIKTMVYPKTIFDTFDDKDNFTISANGEYSTQITLPFYNAVRNNEDGRVINLHINVSYTQADGGAGNTSGRGTLALGKIDQPIGTPVNITSIDGSGFPITQCFGHIQSNGKPHAGLDIGTPENQPLRATLSGEVRVCNFISNPTDRTKDICNRFHIKYGNDSSAYGNMILVTNGTYTTLFGHLKLVPNTPAGITDGVIVNVGDVIAYSGDTGNSSGPHVHYEVRLGNFAGSVMDPLQFASSNPCK